MNLSVLLFQFSPLIAYLLIEYWKGFRAGIYAAIVCSVGLIVYDYSLTGEVDSFVLGESLLIVVLGLVSLRMNNDRYFKFQPTVVAWVFAALFAYFQIFDQPLLQRFTPHLEKIFRAAEEDPGMAADGSPSQLALSQEMLAKLRDPKTQENFARLSFASIWLFLGHGLVMAYAALRLSTRAWFGWRLTIYPAFLAMVVLLQI